MAGRYRCATEFRISIQRPRFSRVPYRPSPGRVRFSSTRVPTECSTPSVVAEVPSSFSCRHSTPSRIASASRRLFQAATNSKENDPVLNDATGSFQTLRATRQASRLWTS